MLAMGLQVVVEALMFYILGSVYPGMNSDSILMKRSVRCHFYRCYLTLIILMSPVCSIFPLQREPNGFRIGILVLYEMVHLALLESGFFWNLGELSTHDTRRLEVSFIQALALEGFIFLLRDYTVGSCNGFFGICAGA